MTGQSIPESSSAFHGLRDREDEVGSVSTGTEDDPVNLAMRATLGEGGAEDEEIILWGRTSATVYECGGKLMSY